MLLRLPLVFLCSVSCAFAAERPSVAAISLNPAALEFARQLIQQGRFVADGKGLWAMHHPSRSAENEFIRVYGSSEYARWHLGIDERHPENTKARYKFPFGDFENLHRCGLLAVRSRARQFGYTDIEAAAVKLLNDNELKRPKR
jgi:hypothetical protein